jgi:hypothetical protein
MTLGVVASLGTLWGAGAMLGAGLALPVLQFASREVLHQFEHRRPVLRLDWPGQGVLALSRHELTTARLACEEGRATLRVGKQRETASILQRHFASHAVEYDSLACSGENLLDVLRVAVPFFNRSGGDRLHLRDAVHHVESGETTESLLNWMATHRSALGPPQDGVVETMPGGLRLAFEMTLNEDDERRALAGELGALYARWEEAERIACISDGELTRLGSTE